MLHFNITVNNRSTVFPLIPLLLLASILIISQAHSTELHKAVERRNLQEVIDLLDSGVDVNATDFLIGSPIFKAVGFSEVEIASILLENGANPNQQGEVSQKTPLHYAAYFDNSAIVELLLDFAADINARDSEGLTALHIASKQGNTESIKALLGKGANINIEDSIKQTTPLHQAVATGELAAVKILIKNKANVNAEDSKGLHPLHLATLGYSYTNVGDASLVSYLLANGANNAREVLEWRQTVHQIDGMDSIILETLKHHIGN